jgi:hypothetical protein
MNISEFVGFLGVFVLLIAFFLNLFGYLDKSSKMYIVMNFTGASIACYASVLIHYFPFVILEGTWSIVSLVAWIKSYR